MNVTKKCEYCGKNFKTTATSNKIFCDSVCSGRFFNKTERHKSYVRKYQKKRGALVKILKEEHPKIYETINERVEKVVL